MIIREALESDLDAIVAMLSDDALGAGREAPGDPRYLSAFRAMAVQTGNTMLVADQDDAVIGCLQMTLIPGLSRGGMLRAQIESVRVRRDARDRGVGRMMIEEAVARARSAGCGLVQLTTDLVREDARRFYEAQGFEASHWGMKLLLDDSQTMERPCDAR